MRSGLVLVVAWVVACAFAGGGAGGGPAADTGSGPHWSHVPPVRREPPAVQAAAWVRNPIDAFVLHRLEEKGLTPAPEAGRRTLARRLFLDLTGLPPSPTEMEEFQPLTGAGHEASTKPPRGRTRRDSAPTVRKTPPQGDARRFGEPPPDGRNAQFRYSRAVRQPEDGCGSAIHRAILLWTDLRIVEDEFHFDTVGKRGKEWWFRVPKSVYDDLLTFKTESPYVFAKLMDQIREFHAAEGRKSAAKMVREFSVYNAGRWFYEQVKKCDSEACVHMFRKTSLQYAGAGQDATQSLAKDAHVSEGVMMTDYVKEEDLQLRAASNAMYQRLCLSMTSEVARAFGHEHSATAILEQRLRGAIGSRNWPLVGEIAKKLAKQDRQAG